MAETDYLCQMCVFTLLFFWLASLNFWQTSELLLQSKPSPIPIYLEPPWIDSSFHLLLLHHPLLPSYGHIIRTNASLYPRTLEEFWLHGVPATQISNSYFSDRECNSRVEASIMHLPLSGQPNPLLVGPLCWFATLLSSSLRWLTPTTPPLSSV